jgi:uncharacterized membrane protein
MRVALFLHVISAVIWVGGMFLAYTAVRPAAVEALEPPQRLRLWTGILVRFFRWVWAAVVLLLLTGFSMMGGMDRVPGHVQAMTGVGILMMAIFLHVYFAPFGRLKRALAAQDWKAGGAALAQIRVLVGINLLLGIANVAVAVLGSALH